MMDTEMGDRKDSGFHVPSLNGNMTSPERKTDANEPTDDEVLFAARAKNFASEVSVAGVKYVFMDTSIIRRALWGLLVVSALAFTSYQIVERVLYYMEYPTAVDVRMNFNNTLRFPTVTICSENTVSKYELLKYGEDVVDLMGKIYPPFPDVEFQVDVNFSQYEWMFDDTDWFMLYYDISQKKEEAIVDCVFKGVRCDARNFTVVATNMGFCYQFNTEEQGYHVDRAGTAHSLQLTLYLNQDEYLVQSSMSAGFRILLHEPGELPLMEEWSFKVPPGFLTLASVTSRNVSELPHPHGDCYDQDDYSKHGCLLNCEAEYIRKECNCKQSYFPGNASVCNPGQRYTCAEPKQREFIRSSLSADCGCPHQCKKVYYYPSLSASPPSNRVISTLLRKFDPDQVTNLSRQDVTDNFGMVEIFYSEMSFEQITTVEAYSLLALICDLGGAMGLLLGSTIITIFEVLDFVLVAGSGAIGYNQQKRKIKKLNL